MTAQAPPVRMGDRLSLPEGDYRFGLGTLVIEVTALPQRRTDDGWLELHGLEIAWNGQRGDARIVWVRPEALRAPDTRAKR